MYVIESGINTSNKEYKENFTHYEKLVKDLKEHIAIAAKGGGEEKIKLHKSRNKMRKNRSTSRSRYTFYGI